MGFRRLVRLLLVLVMFLVAWSCDSSPTSAVDHLASVISVAPSESAVGERVRLLVATTNYGSRIAEAPGCGPGLVFEVTAPDGSTHFPIRGGICMAGDSNHLEPGETDTVTVSWLPPEIRGTYVVRGGFLLPSGITAASAPETFRVR